MTTVQYRRSKSFLPPAQKKERGFKDLFCYVRESVWCTECKKRKGKVKSDISCGPNLRHLLRRTQKIKKQLFAADKTF